MQIRHLGTGRAGAPSVLTRGEASETMSEPTLSRDERDGFRRES